MAFILKGRHDYNFKSKDGNQVSGCQLHLIQQNATSEGFLVEQVSIPVTKPAYTIAVQLPFESVITLVYNKYGKVDDILLVGKPGDEKK